MTSQASPSETGTDQRLIDTQNLLRDIVGLIREGRFGADLDEKLAQADQVLPKKKSPRRLHS